MKKLKQEFASWKDVVVQREFIAIAAFMSKKAKEKNTNKSCSNTRTGDQCYIDGKYNRDFLVRFFEVLREKDSSLYFVMEYMKDGNLGSYIAAKSEYLLSSSKNTNLRTFDEIESKSILFQTFRGLCHIHSLGYVHRDIKPDNILMHGKLVKLTDFSLVRRIGDEYQQLTPKRSHTHQYLNEDQTSCPMMTNYIGTRWYRAPELLPQNPVEGNEYDSYTEAIDVFAMGCVAAELYRCSPLFQSKDEAEQLQLIRDLLLVTTDDEVFRGYSLLEDIKERGGSRLARAIPTAGNQALRFIFSLLEFHPERRVKTEQVLRDDYFKKQTPALVSKREIKNEYGRNDNKWNTYLEDFSLFESSESTLMLLEENDQDQFATELFYDSPINVRWGGKTSSCPVSSPVKVTPSAGTTLRPSHEDPFFYQTQKENGCRVPWGGNNQLSDKDNPSSISVDPSPMIRKRPKLRPSQIFNID